MRRFLRFQEAEESIGQIPQISDLAGQMKAYQQEAVPFSKDRETTCL